MKVVYCGYDFFYSCLERLISMDNIEVVKIFTFDTDNVYNFNNNLIRIALENSIPISNQRITNKDIFNLFEEMNCDCLISAAYPYKIPVDASTNFKGINVHPTLLPIGRGRWPLPAVILKGLQESGVTIHKLNDEFDSGDIILQRAFKIHEREDLESLSCRVQVLAEEMVQELFEDFDFHWGRAFPQGKGEYWDYPSDDEMTFDFSMSITEIDRIVRAYGKFDSCVRFLGKMWYVWDVNTWSENHKYLPGTIVHKTNKEYMIAAKDGFVCLRFFEQHDEEE